MQINELEQIKKQDLDDRSYLWLKINGSCMEPLIKDGDEILVESSKSHLQPGDVIAFKRRDKIFAHRLIELNSGDNSPTVKEKADDSLRAYKVPTSDVIGKAIAVRRGSSVHMLAKAIDGGPIKQMGNVSNILELAGKARSKWDSRVLRLVMTIVKPPVFLILGLYNRALVRLIKTERVPGT